MMWKSLKSFLAFSALALPVLAQPPPPVPSPTPAGSKPKPAYVRFWNMTTVKGATFDLVNDAGPKEAFSSAASRNFTAPYLPIAAATYSFSVYKAGEREVVLKKFPINLRSNVFVTILVSGDKPEAFKFELLDDTWSTEKTTAGIAIIRNFLPDAEASFKVEGKTINVRPGAFETVTGLPLQKVMFALEAKMPDGSVRVWNSEADFKRSRRATLLVFQDGRGQIRPRASEDGVSNIDPEPDRAEPAASPTAANR